MVELRRQLRGDGIGAQSVHVDADGALIAAWHDFGDGVPYESLNMLRFDADGQARLAASLGANRQLAAATLLDLIAARFATWFDLKAFARAHAIRFTAQTDFEP
jgi:hypothetical protein